MKKAQKSNKQTKSTKEIEVIDISALPDINKIEVKINDELTELQIGDKILFPVDSLCLKTIVSMTIFEDGTVNYLLKWHDGTEFKNELVSLTDLKLLNLSMFPKKQITLD